MLSAVFGAFFVVSQVFTATISANQACQQLANELNLVDSASANSLQHACQSLSSNTSVEKARNGCYFARVTLKHKYAGALNLPEYADLLSPQYVNRTESNWYVMKCCMSWNLSNPDIRLGRSSNCWQNATCIIIPESVEDVARVMTIITHTQAAFSIRSGGHDFNVNHSSIGQNGILIDMVNFNQTILSADKRSMTIGVGARWGSVYQTLNGSGVSVNGARSPNPGVGGQTLGGGIGWLSNLVGVCAASVIAAEVVLANSTMVQANSETRSDLLWALRGGGPNFGVVTSFTYNTIPVNEMWFESRLYTPDKNQQLLNALVTYQNMAVNDTKANIVFQLSENASSPQSFVGFLYLDPVERPPIFNPFYNVPHHSTRIKSTIGNLAELASLYYDPEYPQSPPSRYAKTPLSIHAKNVHFNADEMKNY